MDREIKFKVCNKKTGRVLAWEKLTENGWEFAYADAPNIWAGGVFEEAIMGDGYFDGIVRYMYTGKQDKNGVEIYGGSQLSYENLECCEICTVFWDNEDASWRVDFGDNTDCTLSDLDKSLITVIGTIHKEQQ